MILSTMPSSHVCLMALFTSACLTAATEAYTVFDTQCTGPTKRENFVKEPNIRGTMQIIWSSLLTIIACTWTVQHPNVPKHYRGLKKWTRPWLRAILYSLLENGKWMVVTVLAPEYIIMAATNNYLVARELTEDLKSKAREDGVPWTLTHSYYALMGGFVLEDLDSVWGQVEGQVKNPEFFHLNVEELEYLRREDYISRLPAIDEEDINNRCQHDALVKAIALVQILWSIFQAVARAARGLGVNPLEISVLAFAASAVMIYALYWQKPHGIRSTITISLSDKGKTSFKSVYSGLLGISEYVSMPLTGFLRTGGPDRIIGDHVRLDTMSFDHNVRIGPDVFPLIGRRGFELSVLHFTLSVGALGAAVFGAVHLGAWNFPFPSSADQLIWKTAAIHTVAYGPLILMLFIVTENFGGSDPLDKAINLVGIALSWVYVVARVAILVEVVRSLFYLPPEAYIATWTSNLPHFG
ncbi:hypothetical protein QBC43DRAFT_370969 [Cladorrhinum sp. PSN259]|nr:hypothetical protein QBC43DRAFT_370969 [Cladorrhinum sp. PSN259]